MSQQCPIIDVFAAAINKDGSTSEEDDIRFTFGERDGLLSVSVNGGDLVYIPLETINDLSVVYNGINWASRPISLDEEATLDMFGGTD